jgi:hypothetical protein
MSAPVDGCFQEFTDGDSDGDDTVKCGVDSFGAPIQTCSGLTRSDAFGIACRRACSLTDHAAECLTKSKAYCADHQGNVDCKCLFPDNTQVSLSAQTLAYNDLKAFAAKQDFGFDPRCIYHGCASSRGATIIQDYELNNSCPNNPVYCTVSNVTITIDDLQAGTLNPVAQNCGKTSGGGGSQAAQGGGSNKSPLKSKVIPYAIAGGTAVILIGFVVIVLVWHAARVRDATQQLMQTAATELSIDATKAKRKNAKRRAISKT